MATEPDATATDSEVPPTLPSLSAPAHAASENEDTHREKTTTTPLPTETEKITEVEEVTTPAAATLLASEPFASENDALLLSTDNNNNNNNNTTTTAQPKPTPDPELGLKMAQVGNTLSTAAKVKTRKHRFRTFKRMLVGVGSVLFQGLSLLWIGLLYGIPGVIIVALGIVVFIGLPLAFAAAYGSVAMLMGNGILRAARMAHYTNNASAAAIGATGTAIAGPALGFVLNLLGFRYDEENPAPWYTRMVLTVVVHTLSGAIGSAVLLKHHVDLGPIDVLHATRAGALGGALMGPGTIVAMPIVALVLGILFSPLWIAMMMGLRWCYARSSETYEGSVHKYSSCVMYGTCGDDEELNEEIAMAQTPKYTFQTGRNRFISDF